MTAAPFVRKLTQRHGLPGGLIAGLHYKAEAQPALLWPDDRAYVATRRGLIGYCPNAAHSDSGDWTLKFRHCPCASHSAKAPGNDGAPGAHIPRSPLGRQPTALPPMTALAEPSSVRRAHFEMQ